MYKFNRGKRLLVLAAFFAGSAPADEHGPMHHKFSEDVDAFHSVLAPVWHARPGPDRTQDACAKAGKMARLANEIRSTDASQLVASISTLNAQCDTEKRGVDAALFDVHEAFHHLIDMRPDSPKH